MLGWQSCPRLSKYATIGQTDLPIGLHNPEPEALLRFGVGGAIMDALIDLIPETFYTGLSIIITLIHHVKRVGFIEILS